MCCSGDMVSTRLQHVVPTSGPQEVPLEASTGGHPCSPQGRDLFFMLPPLPSHCCKQTAHVDDA